MTLYVQPAQRMPSERATGGTFGRLVPRMWQALADPAGIHHWPAAPDGDAASGEPTSWWIPATQLLTYSFGWSDPGAGLRWWYDVGKPTHEARFALIDQMLGPRVDELAAWYWSSNQDTTGVDPGWIAEVRQRSGPCSPCAEGGYDQLHLSGHTDVPEWPEGGMVDPVLTFDADRQVAALIVDSYAGWYGRLNRVAAMLPATEDRSMQLWRVEVVCRPIGTLGTYRQSTVTGRWFAGSHRHHLVGNARTN